MPLNLGFLLGCLQGNGPNQGPSEYPSQVSGAAVALRSFGEFVLLVRLINSSRKVNMDSFTDDVNDVWIQNGMSESLKPKSTENR